MNVLSASTQAFIDLPYYTSAFGMENTFGLPNLAKFITSIMEWVRSLEQEASKGIIFATAISAKSLAKIQVIIPAEIILPGDPIYKLNFNVNGIVEYTIDGILINVPIFDEEGYGETIESAWDDLLSSIRDKYESLVRKEQGLSSLDHKVLSELRKYLSEATQ